MVAMRQTFDERSRRKLIEKLQEERERHRKAFAILITDKKHGEGAPPELKAYGAAARASYVAGPSPTGRKASVKGSLSYADEMAQSAIEKGRQKVERLQVGAKLCKLTFEGCLHGPAHLEVLFAIVRILWWHGKRGAGLKSWSSGDGDEANANAVAKPYCHKGPHGRLASEINEFPPSSKCNMSIKCSI